ncbi:MAG: DUF983 domain-containing protein [Alphaproteobacteria bacterium]|nr:MAG: DUF983 domain-containing protein [Alphaproteobacteria bacterium]
MAVSPFKAGFKSRCPNCGVGPLYIGVGLRFRKKCDACGADFTKADVGDGGTFFVMFLAFIVFVPAAMIFEFVVRPPVWVHAVIWLPGIVLFSLALLRPFKATMFALQWVHNAGEARLED